MTIDTATPAAPHVVRRLTEDRRRILFAYVAMIGVFIVGGLLNSAFVSGQSIRANLIIASFVGIVAAGQAFVILIGGIDLSVPWVINGAAIMLVSTSLGRNDRALFAVAATLGFGLFIGFVNGVGIAYLSVPAVVMTLGMNGVMEGLTLGRSKGLTCGSCASYAPSSVRALYDTRLLGIPLGLFVWLLIAIAIAFVLSATTFGRRIYAVGNSPRVSFLAGVSVKPLTVVLYMLSGMFAALCGILLVAYGGQPALGMGDPFLFQSIAAVVIGGVSILGGRGHYVGVLAGAVTLVALVSVLQGRQWLHESDRSIVYGVTIIVILLLYGRSREES
ncbi:MAG: ABC transporter permease [Actinomycetota bacterium]